MGDKIKPCTFCGKEMSYHTATRHHGDVWVQCHTCGARGPTARDAHFGGNARPEATRLWGDTLARAELEEMTADRDEERRLRLCAENDMHNASVAEEGVRAELEALRGREHWLKQGVCPECRGCGDIRPEVGCPHCDATGCTEMARAMSRLEEELAELREAAKEVVHGIDAGKDMGEHSADVCDLRALLEPGDLDAGGTK